MIAVATPNAEIVPTSWAKTETFALSSEDTSGTLHRWRVNIEAYITERDETLHFEWTRTVNARNAATATTAACSFFEGHILKPDGRSLDDLTRLQVETFIG